MANLRAHSDEMESVQVAARGSSCADLFDLPLQIGDWVRVGKDTPRRIQNSSDRDAVWLTIGAPQLDLVAAGIHPEGVADRAARWLERQLRAEDCDDECLRQD